MRGRVSFSEYRSMKAAIARLKADRCIVNDFVRGSYENVPYTRHSIRVQGVDQGRLRRNQKRIALYEAECAEVERMIDEAPSVKTREILTMHFLDGMTWPQVGRAMNKAPVTCQQIAQRFFARNGL